MRRALPFVVVALVGLPAPAGAAFDPVTAEHPVWSPDGGRVAFSGADGRGVHVYDLGTGELTTVTDAPSSGYAVRWSPDGARLAFKLLVADGKRPLPWQVPVLFDVASRRLTALGDAVARSGVPSFDASGALAVTRDDGIVLRDPTGRATARHRVGVYANLAALSPDGAWVAFNDDHDAIWLLDTASGSRTRVTAEGAWFDPAWSRDGQRLLLHGVSGRLACLDLASGVTRELPPALQATWLPDGQGIVYASAAVPDGRDLPAADLGLVRCDGSGDRMLTATPTAFETFPAASPDGRSLLYRVEGQGLVLAPLDAAAGTLGAARPLLAGLRARAEVVPGPGDLPPLPTDPLLLAVNQIDGVTYLHQVYDTPNDFDGNWACNATSAMMTIAWRGILAPWDTTVSVPYSHVSHWGNYVSRVYDFGGHHFSESSADPGGKLAYGGYGYITRNDWADTKGYMRDYLRIHGLSSDVDWSPSWDKLKAEVAARQPFVVLSSISTVGHYTVVVGHYTDQHSVIFNDPYGNKNVGGWLAYNGAGVSYDWPGYNNGLANLNTVHCFIWSRAPEPQPGVVAGTVRDAATGAALAGATVGLDTGPSTETGPDGTYRFDGLAAGPYTVTAAAACRGLASLPAAVAAGGTTTVDFELAEDGSCATTGAVEGTVTDAGSGAPLAGVPVLLDGGAAEAVTDAAGRYAFADVEPGAHAVSARAACHGEARADVTVTAGESVAGDLALTPELCAGDLTPYDPAGTDAGLAGGCALAAGRGGAGAGCLVAAGFLALVLRRRRRP